MALQLASARSPVRPCGAQPRPSNIVACSATKQRSMPVQQRPEGPSRRALQFVSVIGAIQLAFLPFSDAVSARPSDMMQSRKGEDKLTKFPGKPSISGNQAREASTRKRPGASTGEKPQADARAETALNPDKAAR